MNGIPISVTFLHSAAIIHCSHVPYLMCATLYALDVDITPEEVAKANKTTALGKTLGLTDLHLSVIGDSKSS